MYFRAGALAITVGATLHLAKGLLPVSHGPFGVEQCLIDGVTYDAGAANPANPCLVCTPGASATTWSPASDGAPCPGGACQAAACTISTSTGTGGAASATDAGGGGATASGGASSTTGVPDDGDVDTPNCGCRMPGSPPRHHAWLAALPALLAMRRRRRLSSGRASPP